MEAAWSEAGKSRDSLYSTAFVLGAVLDEGEPFDGPKAMAQAGPWVAVVFHNLVEAEERGSITAPHPMMEKTLGEYQKLYQSYQPEDARYLSLHARHLIEVRDDERHLITGEMIREFTFTGTREEICGKLEAMRDAGYSQVAVQVVRGQEKAIEDWAGVIRYFNR